MKNYARLFKGIFSDCEGMTERDINENVELVETLQELIAELGYLESMALEEFVVENKTLKDFADYIRNNADEIADLFMAKAYRCMRHPSRSRKLVKYLKKS